MICVSVVKTIYCAVCVCVSVSPNVKDLKTGILFLWYLYNLLYTAINPSNFIWCCLLTFSVISVEKWKEGSEIALPGVSFYWQKSNSMIAGVEVIVWEDYRAAMEANL